MATRVRLTADVDAEVKKRVRIAAIQSETSVSEWIERAVLHELDRERRSPANRDRDGFYLPPPGAKPRGSRNPIKLRGGKSMAETVIEDREARDRSLSGAATEDRGESDPGWYREDMATMPPPGAKPKGTENPPRLRDGSLISDAVIEDRR